MIQENKTTALRRALAIGATALALGGGAAQARDLTIVSFGGTFQDAQRELFFKPFAEKLGKPVLDEAWDGGYGVLQSKVKAGQPNWDVVQVEAEELALGCADGIFEKLDWEKLGGQDSFIPGSTSECGAGHIVWSVAIAYDGNKLTDQQPQSWADFWDVEKFPGKRGMRKTAKYALEAALMADGVPSDQVYEMLATPEGVDRAFAKLDELRPDNNIEISEPGRYEILLRHIEVHQYLRSLDMDRAFTWEEAVQSWYDTVYMPMVEAIRRYGVLEHFPTRTETDLYLWIAHHREELAQRYGLAPLSPDTAVSTFAEVYSGRPLESAVKGLRFGLQRAFGLDERPLGMSEDEYESARARHDAGEITLAEAEERAQDDAADEAGDDDVNPGAP